MLGVAKRIEHTRVCVRVHKILCTRRCSPLSRCVQHAASSSSSSFAHRCALDAHATREQLTRSLTSGTSSSPALFDALLLPLPPLPDGPPPRLLLPPPPLPLLVAILPAESLNTSTRLYGFVVERSATLDRALINHLQNTNKTHTHERCTQRRSRIRNAKSMSCALHWHCWMRAQCG